MLSGEISVIRVDHVVLENGRVVFLTLMRNEF